DQTIWQCTHRSVSRRGFLGGGECRRLPDLANAMSTASQRHAPPPAPHLLVLVFQLPHFLPTQSPIRSFEPSSSFDQASPGTRPGVFHTVLNWPSPRTSPMNTGLVMWWFGSHFEITPLQFGASNPGQ